MSASVHAARRQHVTAILVAHDGERWLPRLIAALSASTRPPDRIVAVDAGSVDGSRRLLVDAFGTAAVLDTARTTGFGASVARALAATDREPDAAETAAGDSWVWLLHDDCAPAADALERLLDTGSADSSLGVIGCRLRAWPRGRRLLEVGSTITGTGHRETGVEPGEYDQGQYEQRRDVLAVSSAAMLVRRSVWDRLGGFDPQLPLFRDDVDFGWRAAKLGHRVAVGAGAVVFHAEAAARGVRDISCTSADPHRAARRAALFTLLANCRGTALPFQYVRLLVGSTLRALGYLLGKLPRAAWSELAAAASVLGRPGRLGAARSRRRSLVGGDASAVRALLPSWWTPYANGIDLVASQFVGRRIAGTTSGQSATRLLRAGRGDATALETGPVSDEAVSLSTGSGPVSKARASSLLLLLTVLTFAALVASRSRLGTGFLQGGGLLPAPDSAIDWWRSYGAAWHPVRLGSTQPAAPYVAVLAIGGTALLGKAWLLVDLIMLFAPVAAALGAFVASGRLVRSRPVRIWMTATYALLPVVSGSTSTGRIGTVTATILLPWLVLPVAAMLRARGWPWRQMFAAAAVLALVCAFTPVAGVLAAALLVGAFPLLIVRRQARVVVCGLGTLLLAGALLLPWSQRFLSKPGLLFTEAGSNAPTGGESPLWQVAFGRIGGSGQAPWWVTAGLLTAAFLALLRAESRARVAAAWAVGAVALGLAAVMSRQLVHWPGAVVSSPVWLGFPVSVAQAAAVVAAGLGADGLRRSIAAGSFGWRQPLAAFVTAVAISAPVTGLLWWAAVAPHGELHRKVAVPLPAYLADAMRSPPSPRVLVVTGTERSITYDVIAGEGRRLGDDSVLPALPPATTSMVAAVLAPSRSTSAARLSQAGIGYVVSPRPVDSAVAARLDALSGLTRTSTAGSLWGWQVRPGNGPAPRRQVSEHKQSTRRWELAGQGALWLTVLIAASPGISRPTGLERSA